MRNNVYLIGFYYLKLYYKKESHIKQEIIINYNYQIKVVMA